MSHKWRRSSLVGAALFGVACMGQAAELLPNSPPTYSSTPVSTLYTTTFNTGVDSDYIGYEVNGKWYGISYDGSTESAPPTRATPPWTTGSTEKALKFSPQALPNRTGLQYILPLALNLNTRYRISMRVGTATNASMTMRVALMGSTTNYAVFPVVRQVTIPAGTAYKDVVINGVFAVNEGPALAGLRGLRILPLTANQPIYIDNVKVEVMATSPVNMAHNAGFGMPTTTNPLPMDPKMFGLHVNELGSHNTWPELGQNVVRLWGQPTMWFDLETAQNTWAWNSGYDGLTYHVDYIIRNRPNADIIYTLGQSPTWASSNPTLANCSYSYRQLGTCAPPNNPTGNWDDWKDYIRTVATRNLGKIKYYEVWNEPGVSNFFNSPNSAATMAAMTCAAKDALQSVDSNLKLIGPAVSGLWMDEYVEAGGAACADILNHHWYFAPSTVEGTMPADMANLKFMMLDYNLYNKPIWNTESGARCTDSDGTTFCPANYSPSDGVLRGTMIRSLALQWANGITNFDYFFMEGGFEPWSALVLRKPAGSTCQLTINGCLNHMTTTPLGAGYIKAGQWMKNMQLTAAYTNAAKDVFIFKMKTSTGALRYLLWTTAAAGKTVRAPSGWAITTVEQTTGTSSSYSYDFWGIGADIALTALEPVLLKP